VRPTRIESKKFLEPGDRLRQSAGALGNETHIVVRLCEIRSKFECAREACLRGRVVTAIHVRKCEVVEDDGIVRSQLRRASAVNYAAVDLAEPAENRAKVRIYDEVTGVGVCGLTQKAGGAVQIPFNLCNRGQEVERARIVGRGVQDGVKHSFSFAIPLGLREFSGRLQRFSHLPPPVSNAFALMT
jgi:hypothetical protein